MKKPSANHPTQGREEDPGPERKGMKYQEWFGKHGHFDGVVRGLLAPDVDLEAMTRTAFKEKFEGKIVGAALGVGLELAEGDLDAMFDRLAGIREWPEFHPSHYDLHC